MISDSGKVGLSAVVWCGMGILAGCGGGKSSSHPTIQMGGAIQGNALSLKAAVTTSTGVSVGSVDATGAAARFDLPVGITTDGSSLHVADQYTNTIRKNQ